MLFWTALALYEAYIVKGLCADKGIAPDELTEDAFKYWEYIPTEYQEELQAFSETSNFDLKKLFVISVVAELSTGSYPLCSSFAYCNDKSLMVGRNLDWMNYSIAHKNGVIVLYKPVHRKAFYSITWPGMGGVITGINEDGLIVTLNVAFGGKEVWQVTPMLFRLRNILENAESIEEATEILICEKRPLSCNVLIADAKKKKACIIEMSGDKHAILWPDESGLAVSTNYYQKLNIPGGLGSDRKDIICNVFHQSKSGDYRTSIRALREAKLFSLSPKYLATIHSVVFLPNENLAYIAMGKFPATSGRYYKYNFTF